MKETIAKDLLKISAVFLRPDEPFTWASGIKSPIYCDNRLTLSDVDVRNDVENAFAKLIKEKYPEARIVALPAWWVTAGELLPEGTFEVWDGLGHAGEGESSIAYYLYPQWNEPDQAKGFVPDMLPPYVDVKWDFSELTNCAATGDPTKATAEKGKMMEEVLVKACTEAIRDLDANGWDYRTKGIR